MNGYWQISGNGSIMRALAVAGMMLAVSACGIATVDNRGYVASPDIAERVKIGESTREDVRGALGSPSTVSDFPPETWYYISREKETVAFLKPELTKQDVMQIEFDEFGKVSKFVRYGKDVVQDVQYVERKTPTEGRSVGLVEQLLGNLGKFNTPRDATQARQ